MASWGDISGIADEYQAIQTLQAANGGGGPSAGSTGGDTTHDVLVGMRAYHWYLENRELLWLAAIALGAVVVLGLVSLGQKLR